jgi:hypothetical protein
MDLLHAQAGKGETIQADLNGNSLQAYLAKAENHGRASRDFNP